MRIPKPLAEDVRLHESSSLKFMLLAGKLVLSEEQTLENLYRELEHNALSPESVLKHLTVRRVASMEIHQGT